MSATLPTDRYELQDRLGAGGMAKVFRAFDHALSRTVAVKMLHDDLVSNEELRQRFLREARVFARLRHPHIIEIHDVVHGEQSAAMVMEFIDGTDLSHLAKRQPLRVPELAVAVLRPVMDALSHAHAEGVIHRDVKPANIMLSRDGRVKLGDFGIAKVLEETHLTHTGEFLGTPAYIAPEQARGETITAAVDQYALGVVLYELLAGRPPYTGPTPLAVLSQILIGKFPDIRELNEAVDERLAAVVHRTLNADPAARFADVAALMAALDTLVPPISGTRERQIVAGLVADPASTVASVAQAVAEECLTTARRALAQGDVSQARTSARQALSRTPDNAEAKEMLDTLRQSVGQIVALPSGAPANAAETLGAARPAAAPSRFKLGLGAAGVALLTAAGLSTLFREPPPRVEPPVVTAAVEPAQRAPLATEPPRAAPPSMPPPAPESAAPAASERPAPRAADPPPREKPLPVRPAAAAEAPATAAPASVAPRVGHLRLVTQPWADVEIDGQHAGRTPYMPDAELSAGPHRLVLRNPGLPEHVETIRIEAGQTLQRRVNLMPAGTSP